MLMGSPLVLVVSVFGAGGCRPFRVWLWARREVEGDHDAL
jgi:hypothetical protein